MGHARAKFQYRRSACTAAIFAWYAESLYLNMSLHPDVQACKYLGVSLQVGVQGGRGRVRLPKGCEGLEVSPTVSYSGEGLTSICRGRTFRQPHDVFLQVDCLTIN